MALTMAQVNKIVKDNWGYFSRSWTNVNQALNYYGIHTGELEDEMVGVQHYNASQKTQAPRSKTEQSENQRLTALAIENIKTLWAEGFTAEQIQELVPCYIAGEKWAERSIACIGRGIGNPLLQRFVNSVGKF